MQLDYNARQKVIKYLDEQIAANKDALIQTQPEIDTARLRGRIHAFSDLKEQIEEASK